MTQPTSHGKLLGDVLSARRKELGYSLSEVRKRTERKISTTYIAKLEAGASASPSPHILHDLSHALGIPYVTLMEAAGYVYPSGHEQPRPGALVSALLQADDLTPTERASLDAYLAAHIASWREHLRGLPESDVSAVGGEETP